MASCPSRSDGSCHPSPSWPPQPLHTLFGPLLNATGAGSRTAKSCQTRERTRQTRGHNAEISPVALGGGPALTQPPPCSSLH